MADAGLETQRVLEARGCSTMLVSALRGAVRGHGFETRASVSLQEYETMIGGKTGSTARRIRGDRRDRPARCTVLPRRARGRTCLGAGDPRRSPRDAPSSAAVLPPIIVSYSLERDARAGFEADVALLPLASRTQASLTPARLQHALRFPARRPPCEGVCARRGRTYRRGVDRLRYACPSPERRRPWRVGCCLRCRVDERKVVRSSRATARHSRAQDRRRPRRSTAGK